MAEHRACHGCLDGCTRESAVHCVSCVVQPWPCDAYTRGRFLMSAAAEVHFWRKHPPYGSSFLDCDHTICQEHRVALGLPLHGYAATVAGRPLEDFIGASPHLAESMKDGADAP